MEQQTEAWFQARLGKVTASRLSDVLATTKTGPSASRANYMADLIAERLTGQPAESFSSPAMRWGTETEPQARARYEFDSNVTVEEVGFIAHPHIAMAGASPDGLVGHDGLVEIKCPNTATHIDTLLGKTSASKYVTQVQWQMACTGRAWCDLVSFDPRLPIELQISITRIVRDPKFIAEAESAVKGFLSEIEAKVTALRDLAASTALAA